MFLIKIWNILPRDLKKKLIITQFSIMIASSIEMVTISGISLLMNLLQRDPNNIGGILGRIYNFFNFTNYNSFLFAVSIGIALAILFGNLFIVFRNYTQNKLNEDINKNLSVRLFKYYLNQNYLYHTKNHTGILSFAVRDQVQVISNSIIRNILEVNGRMFLILSFFVAFLVMAPFEGMVFIGSIVFIYMAIFYFFKGKIKLIGESFVTIGSRMNKVLQEAFGGIKEIKFLGIEDTYTKEYTAIATMRSKMSVTMATLQAAPRFIVEGIVFAGVVFFVMLLVHRNGNDIAATITTLSFFMIGGYKLLPAINLVYTAIIEIKRCIPIVDVMEKDLLDSKNLEFKDIFENKVEKIEFLDSIQIKDLNFRYVLELPVLKKLNLSIQKNTTVAFVGGSGAGKTTLIDIFLGLIEQQSGFIIVDGVLIDKSNKRAWQNILGYVPQGVYLADLSIEENIAFGIPKEKIDKDKVIKVSKMACLDEFILTLSAQYNTVVGERGIQLSGGQKQRIGIARALYHDAEILVFDEATSALDNITEKAIMESIHSLSHQKTILIIAHRLSTIKEADVIYLLEKGEVADKGTFDELLQRNKHFQKMNGLKEEESSSLILEEEFNN